MTFAGCNFNFGTSPMGPGRGGAGVTRGRIQGSLLNGVNYPNPFFDVAHTYLPTTVKELFKYCRYYFLTNSLINATCFKLAEYPVTDIIVDHERGPVKKRWEEYYHDHLQFRSFQVECGLDYQPELPLRQVPDVSKVWILRARRQDSAALELHQLRLPAQLSGVWEHRRWGCSRGLLQERLGHQTGALER